VEKCKVATKARTERLKFYTQAWTTCSRRSGCKVCKYSSHKIVLAKPFHSYTYGPPQFAKITFVIFECVNTMNSISTPLRRRFISPSSMVSQDFYLRHMILCKLRKWSPHHDRLPMKKKTAWRQGIPRKRKELGTV
jgi:hypothetical protein